MPSPSEIDRIVAEIAASREAGGGLPPVDGTVRARRLAACATCESLAMEVLCAHCGCFVTARALDPSRKCPHPAGNRWA